MIEPDNKQRSLAVFMTLQRFCRRDLQAADIAVEPLCLVLLEVLLRLQVDVVVGAALELHVAGGAVVGPAEIAEVKTEK